MSSMPAATQNDEVIGHEFSLTRAACLLLSAVGGVAVSILAISFCWDAADIFRGGFVLPLLALTSLISGGLTGAAASLSLLGQRI